MASPDLLFNLRNLFYLGADQAAINNSDVPGLDAAAAAECDAIIFLLYIALGSYQVLGTPTREELQCMNQNYTVFRFPRIKAHTSHKFTIILLLRHPVTVVTVGAANQFAFSLLTVYLLRASGILLRFLRCHEAHLRDLAGTEAIPPAATPG